MADLFRRSLRGRLVPIGAGVRIITAEVDVSAAAVPDARVWDVDVSVWASAVLLPLRSAFGTSHSTTTSRTNARMHVSITVSSSSYASGASQAVTGISEVGMPPKKPYVYEADISDVARASFYVCFHYALVSCCLCACSFPGSDLGRV